MDLEIKKILAYSIVPALIAGAFALAPKLYDVIKEPRAELTYERTIGPDLVTDTQHRQIAAVTFVNSGNRPLSSVSTYIAPIGGVVQAYQFQAAPNLNGATRVAGPGIVSEVDRLLPGEQFSVSLMLSNDQGKAELSIGARSNEVLGIAVRPEQPRVLSLTELLGPFLGALSVFLMAISTLIRKGPFWRRLAKLTGKPDAIYYVAARLGISELAKDVRFADVVFLRDFGHAVKQPEPSLRTEPVNGSPA